MHRIKRPKVVFLLALTSVSVITGTILITSRSDDGQQIPVASDVLSVTSFRDQASNISFSYPSEANKLDTTEQDSKEGILARIQQANKPEYFINVRKETGLRMPASLASLDVLDLVVDGAQRSYSRKYANYKVENEYEEELNGHDAYTIIFTYTGPSGEEIKQMTTLIKLDGDSSLYITQQSRSSDFSKIQGTVFKPLLESLNI